jgi:hypothetical protein
LYLDLAAALFANSHSLEAMIRVLTRISHQKQAHRQAESAKVLLPQRIFLTQETTPTPTECIPDSFNFASLGGRKVTAAFDGGAITSNAGALLLRETDRAIRLSRQAAACFTNDRRQDRIEHSVETLLAQRIHGCAWLRGSERS